MAQSEPINEQLVSFLRQYIQIDTTHPTPAYDEAIVFLERHFSNIFSSKQVLLPSGKKVLIISVEGSDKSLKSLALNHHMDVVPANPQGWSVPPFAGQIVNGNIIGRGTQDMKGIGAIHFFALKQLVEAGFKPKRSIHIFAVPEEEVGGFKGTKEFVQTEDFKNLNIGYIIDEGHASGIDNVFDIKVAERKPIQIMVETTGELAHGSHLQCTNAIHQLVQFLNEIVKIHNEGREKSDKCQPGQLLSCNITSLTAGVRKEDGHIALNMVPASAQATIDIRVPPTIKKTNVIILLETTIAKFNNPQNKIQYKILAQAAEEPELKNYQSELYCALAKTIKKCVPDSNVQPHFFEASSDLRFYQALGIDGIGFTPFTIKDNIHGIDESVPVDQLIRAKDITAQFIIDFDGMSAT